jgi:leucyl aminopeptidase (aminopeptidase T)
MAAESIPDATSLAGAMRIVSDLSAVEARSTVLLVHDMNSDAAALAALRSAIDHVGARRTDTTAERFLSASQVGVPEEVPEVTISLATPLLTHTDRIRAFLARASRYVNLRGIDTEALREVAVVDFDELDVRTREVTALLGASRRITVCDLSGTEVQFSPLRALALSGVARSPGSIGGYPGGEAAVVPLPGSVQGVVRSPVYVEGFTERDPGVEFHIVSDQVMKIVGHGGAAYLENAIGSSSGPARTVSEFGAGTNNWVNLRSPRTAKKRLGTAHFGIGDNQTFGGSVVADHHIDVIMERPTVVVDGRELIGNGMVRRSG